MGHAYANYFSTTYIVCHRKMPKKSPFHFLEKNPVKVIAPTNKTISIAYLLQGKPALARLLLASLRFYNNVQTDGNGVDPNQADSKGAG